MGGGGGGGTTMNSSQFGHEFHISGLDSAALDCKIALPHKDTFS
jgi:hypothetical protein